MKHSTTCGGHKQAIFAKDIHTGTNMLIFHARSYNIHNRNNIVRSRDYLLQYSPTTVPSVTTATTSNKKRKKTTTSMEQHQHQQLPLKATVSQ